MKRWMAGLLSAVLLLTVGCGAQVKPTQTAAQTWVTYEDVSQRVKSEENKDILIYSYQQPVLHMDSSVASVVNNKLGNATTAFLYGSGGVQELTDMAKMDWREPWFTCYALEREVSVARMDEAVVSFRYRDYAFTGGAHGYTAEYGVSYDLSTGDQLSLNAITHDEWKLKETCRQYIMDLVKTDKYENGEMFFEGFESDLDTVLKNWLFTEDGLQFIAQPYVIAPYAVGTLRFTVPYEKLEGVLNEQWMPEKRGVGSGSLSLTAGTGSGTAYVVGDGTVPVTIKVNGAVYGLSVEEVNSYHNGEDYFYYVVKQHLHCPVLTSGASFTLQIPEIDERPTTMVRFKTGDGTEHQYYISSDGTGGKYSLVEAEPQLSRNDT